MAEERNLSVLLPCRAQQRLILRFHVEGIPVGRHHANAIGFENFRDRVLESGKIAVASHTINPYVRVSIPQNRFHRVQIAHAVAAVHADIGFRAAKTAFHSVPEHTGVAVAVAEGDDFHNTSASTARICSMARARWLTLFFAAPLISAKVLSL